MASLFTNSLRNSVAFADAAPSRTAATQLLYTQRAALTHSKSVCFCSLVGYRRMCLTRITLGSAAGSGGGSALGGIASTVVTGGKDGCDGEQILCQFVKSAVLIAVGNGAVGVCSFVKNHDFCVLVLENALDEWVGKAAEAVTIGNHNLGEISLQRAFQNGLKAFSLPINSTPDITVADGDVS